MMIFFLFWYEAVVVDACAHQAILSLSLHSWSEETKYNQRLVGQDKARDITRQLLSWTKETWLG